MEKIEFMRKHIVIRAKTLPPEAASENVLFWEINSTSCP